MEKHTHTHTVSLTEGDEELAVASALVGRQREDTRHVVPIRRLFLLKEQKENIYFINFIY